MEKFKDRYKSKNDPIKWAFFGIIIVIIMLTIGYAGVGARFSISGNFYVRSQADIRLTGLRLANTANGGLAGSAEHTATHLYADINLPSSSSTITYWVEVTNFGNEEMGIETITGLPQGLEYSFTGYTLEATLCDSNDNLKCTLGSVSRFQITIGYAENGYNSSNTQFNLDLLFNFYVIDNVARIGDVYYTTFQAAINAVPSTGVQTTIVLLKNSVQNVIVNPGKNILLDMSGLVLTNDGNNPVITIRGVASGVRRTSTVTMTNGTIYADSTSNQGAINVEDNGVFNMSGGSIICDSVRQAIYIYSGGSVTISGSAYLNAKAFVDASNKRGTVQALSGSSLTILGGTIVASGTNGIGVSNAGTTTLGIEDGNVSASSPSIQGIDYGVYLISGGTFNFYDGIVKGKVAAINSEVLITDKETDYGILHDTETISGDTYYTANLTYGAQVTVTFDPGDGTTDEPTRQVLVGTAVGGLPTATRTGYRFMGWFTANDRQIDASETITAAVTFFAHWLSDACIAMVGNTYYSSLQAAVDAVPTNNTRTTVTLLTDISNENIVVAANQNIDFNLQNYTVSMNAGTVLTNYGTIEIRNGTILRTPGTKDEARTLENKSTGTVLISGGSLQSTYFNVIRNYGAMTITGGSVSLPTNVDQGVINNESGGTLTISGGTVRGYKRQAVYNDGGTLTITGSAHLESDITVTAKVRGAVQNNSGTTIITGGTIISNSTSNPAVMNNATMTIGTNDGVIDITSPVIQSRSNGLRIESGKTVYFYDGIIRGGSSSAAINNESRVVTDTQNNVTIGHRDDVVGGVTYKTAYPTQ